MLFKLSIVSSLSQLAIIEIFINQNIKSYNTILVFMYSLKFHNPNLSLNIHHLKV
jgi:hypothetical protein